jgi:hypothetical protein
VVVTESLCPSVITLKSESCSNVERLVRSLQIWCDDPESMTHFRDVVEAARDEAVSQIGSQSLVVARAAVAVAFFTVHNDFICCCETQTTLT